MTISLPFDPSSHDRQYNHMYFCRLIELAPFVNAEISKRSSSPISIKDLKKTSTDVYIVGVLFIDFPSRPTILTEVSCQKIDHSWREKYSIYIEDQSARISVSNNLLDILPACTGIVIGLKGRMNDTGSFESADFVLPGAPKLKQQQVKESRSIGIIEKIPSCPQKRDFLKTMLVDDKLISSVNNHLALYNS
jgi:hypothetical protein